MQRLSQDVSTLESHYDVIVVGSGYGGSIAACRLARAGRSVALFERGRELHPGEYPSTKEEAAREIQASVPGASDSNDNGLYWFHVGKEMSVFSGCGLGGTSLVNANVSLEPDKRLLADPRWPAALRSDAEGLQAAYGRARAMLGPTTYPDSYPALPKMAALKVAAGTDSWYPTPINVTFRPDRTVVGRPPGSVHRLRRLRDRVQHGAKNTVLMNYLPDAVPHGARIFSELDVRWIERGSRARLGGPRPADRPGPGRFRCTTVGDHGGHGRAGRRDSRHHRDPPALGREGPVLSPGSAGTSPGTATSSDSPTCQDGRPAARCR